MTSIASTLELRIGQFETRLQERLIAHLSGSPSNLNESIQYSLLAPGKRIRPRLALTTGLLLGLTSDQSFPAAIAIEMVHCFTLIHDDLPCMDNDDYRRGRLANHKVHGEALALLAGDSLMALAVDALFDAEGLVETKALLQGLKILSWAMGARGVIGGQAEESQVMAHPSFDAMKKMHAKKTGALFAASILIPKAFAQLSSNTDKGRSLENFAQELGLAFQAADDFDDREKDIDPKTGRHLPTNVLHYLSLDEARSQSQRSLRNAISQLQNAWGDAAQALIDIACEVEKKL